MRETLGNGVKTMAKVGASALTGFMEGAATEMKAATKRSQERQLEETRAVTDEELSATYRKLFTTVHLTRPTDGRRATLYSVVHVAPQEFYSRLTDDLIRDNDSGRTVFHEGFKKKTPDPTLHLLYSAVAEISGLAV